MSVLAVSGTAGAGANGLAYVGAIGVLAVLIVVHELGHFLAARSQGIRVSKFSIGFGPVLWRYQGPETEYALRAIPLGGFVGFPDEDPDSDIPADDPNLLQNRPLWDRAIVISAGVIANLVFAYCLLVSQLGIVGIPDGIRYQPGVVIPQVMAETSPAAQAGIKAGDIVLAVEGQPLAASKTAIPTLMGLIQDHPGQALHLTLQRGEEQLPVTVTPTLGSDGKGRIGVQLFPNGMPIYRRPHHPIELFTLAATEFQNIIEQIIQGLGLLITHFRDTAGQVSGPVKIVEMGANIAQADALSLFTFAAFISINLAIINILPLPALDGGQLLLLLVEGVRGKPLPTGLQEGVMQTGLVLLLGLGVFLIVRDTAQLEWVQRLLQ